MTIRKARGLVIASAVAFLAPSFVLADQIEADGGLKLVLHTFN